MPEHDPEQELGPKITAALRNQADSHTELQKGGLAHEARRRVRKRRQTLGVAAAAVVVAVAIGGVWNLADVGSPVASKSDNSAGSQAAPESAASGRATNGIAPPKVAPTPAACPATVPILTTPTAVPAGKGLDLNTKVTGMTACRYGPKGLLGQESFPAHVAQQVVDEIKVLPERNPDLPVFKCTPQAAKPSEAIVLRFGTADGIREIWVQYDGCDSAGFFTGTHTYGLFAAPLKLFMVGAVRPPGGTYLNALGDW